jgi:hypothetical protein
MTQMRNPAEQGGVFRSPVHAAKLNVRKDTHLTATNQVLSACLTGSDACSAAGVTVTRCAPLSTRAIQDRAERMATATIQIICAKSETTASELWPQLVEMYRDELAGDARQRAEEIRLQDDSVPAAFCPAISKRGER